MIEITLYRPSTGTRVTFDFADDLSSLEGLDYMWCEGNLSCDCNRARYFPDDELWAMRTDGRGQEDCGHTCIIESMKMPNGSIFILNDECQATYVDGVITDPERFV